jgi:hypothetical protein
MSKRYVYKNVNRRLVNIGGYQFKEGQELESDILIDGFNEAVSNGFLDLFEQESERVEQNATQAPQTGDTGKVRVIFHMGVSTEGKELLKEVEIDPNAPVSFPDIDLLEGFEGWFKDEEFTRPVNTDKAKSPKKGEIHFYGKYEIPQGEDTPPANQNGDAGSVQEKGRVILSSPPISGEPAPTGSEIK